MNHSMNPAGARPYGVPFPAPIESLPPHAVTGDESAQMLRAAVEHAGPLGDVDRDVLRFHLDSAYLHARGTAVFASLIRRAWQAGVEVGRTERLEETGRAQAVAKAAERAVWRYQAVLSKVGRDYADRQLAIVVAVETAVALLDSDAEIAAAVRAVVEADQAQDVAAQAVLQDRTFLGQACAAPLPGEATQRDEVRPELTEAEGSRPVTPAELQALRGRVQGLSTEIDEVLAEDDELVEVEWCRICDEVATRSVDGVCQLCREDITERRESEADVAAERPSRGGVL